MEELQEQWKKLYATELPALAKAKDSAQKHWPVNLDHCFARIILDNAVGIDKPWTETIKSPAIHNMTQEQFDSAIKLARGIMSGSEDLDALNRRSLDLRGKNGPSAKRKPEVNTEAPSKKQKSVDSADVPSKKNKKSESGNISTYFLPSPQSPPEKNNNPSTKDEANDDTAIEAVKKAATVDMDVQLKRIANSNLTAFRKQTLSMLCQIPRGRYSTYQAMSDFITESSHKTCARAVGNAMRNNPFAPEVPCHRILAANGTLGGFGGHWGEDGKFAQEKHRLLHDEGVRFDSKGKVKGPPFRDFKLVS